MPLHPDFDQVYGGYTSDHAHQIVSMAFSGLTKHRAIVIKGASWNTLNRCHNRDECHGRLKYSNNPSNTSETPDQYHSRKLEQINQIVSLIEKQKLDYFFLQEVDWILPPNTDEKRAIRKELADKLEKIGWAMTKTTAKDGVKQTPLVTLYNKRKLTLLNFPKQCGVLPVTDSDRTTFQGFSQLFSLAGHEGVCVRLVNLHLVYGVKNNDALRDMLKSVADAKSILIMGGDTNYPFQRHTTNFACADDAAFTDWHKAVDSRKKGYDAFFAAGGEGVTLDYSGSTEFTVSEDGSSVTNAPRQHTIGYSALDGNIYFAGDEHTSATTSPVTPARQMPNVGQGSAPIVITRTDGTPMTFDLSSHSIKKSK